MITLEKASKPYEECTSCGSTDDVHFIRIHQRYAGSQSFKLCVDCRKELCSLMTPVKPIRLCPECGCKEASYMGELELHAVHCSYFPL